MSRARRSKKPDLGRMQVVATASVRFARMGPRKVRDVADVLRGLTLAEAQSQLQAIHRPSSVPVLERLLKSALSNANHKLERGSYAPEDLMVGEIFVDSGPMLTRYRPRAMGRATVIRKRASHITVRLYGQPA